MSGAAAAVASTSATRYVERGNTSFQGASKDVGDSMRNTVLADVGGNDSRSPSRTLSNVLTVKPGAVPSRRGGEPQSQIYDAPASACKRSTATRKASRKRRNLEAGTMDDLITGSPDSPDAEEEVSGFGTMQNLNLMAMREAREEKKAQRYLINPKTAWLASWDMFTAVTLLFIAVFTPFEVRDALGMC